MALGHPVTGREQGALEEGTCFPLAPPGMFAQPLPRKRASASKKFDSQMQSDAEPPHTTCKELVIQQPDKAIPEFPPGVFAVPPGTQRISSQDERGQRNPNCLVTYQTMIMPVYISMPKNANAQVGQWEGYKSNSQCRQVACPTKKDCHVTPQQEQDEVLNLDTALALKRSVSNSTNSTAEGEASVVSGDGGVKSCSEATEIDSNTVVEHQDSYFSDNIDIAVANLESTDAESRKCAFQWVSEAFWPLALNKKGCRLVQKAMDAGTPTYLMQLLEQLKGKVHEAIQSPHANYVLQKFIEMVRPERIQFIVEEANENALHVARHRFGCRIIQRLIEHCTPGQLEGMLNEILLEAEALCRHQYGNFILQHILEYGSASQRGVIAGVIRADIMNLSKHRLASHIVSGALVHCSREDIESLTEAVLEDPDQLYHLSRREYGSFVVREVTRATARLLHSHGGSMQALEEVHSESSGHD